MRDERGAVAVLVMILLPVLLGCLSLVIATGVLELRATQTQTAADAAALSLAMDCDGTTAARLVEENMPGGEIASADCGEVARVVVRVVVPLDFVPLPVGDVTVERAASARCAPRCRLVA